MDFGSDEGENQSNGGEVAIRRAMSSALKEVLKKKRVEQRVNGEDDLMGLDLLEKATRGECEEISTLTLSKLRNHPEFPIRFLLHGNPGKTGFNNSQWLNHVVGIAGGENEWFGFSPANFEMGTRGNLTRIVRGSSVGEVVNKVAQENGGEWPVSHFVSLEVSRRLTAEICDRSTPFIFESRNGGVKIKYNSVPK